MKLNRVSLSSFKADWMPENNFMFSTIIETFYVDFISVYFYRFKMDLTFPHHNCNHNRLTTALSRTLLKTMLMNTSVSILRNAMWSCFVLFLIKDFLNLYDYTCVHVEPLPAFCLKRWTWSFPVTTAQQPYYPGLCKGLCRWACW